MSAPDTFSDFYDYSARVSNGCFVRESASTSVAVSTPYLQFPTITGFVNGVNSDCAEYLLRVG